ncbi:MAG: hypothetical protein U1E60_01175 [Reyranellaceae bacterium]
MSSFRLAHFTLPLLVGLALGTAGCGAPPLIVGASYAADGGLLATSNKTSTDHLVSMVSKKDCAVWRAFKSRPICSEREDGQDPYAVDYAQPQRVVAEDGVHYIAPLRPADGAPATSWDPAAYASAPAAAAAPPAGNTLAPPPAAPVKRASAPTVTAEATPTRPTRPPKATARKTKPVKKASPGPAAPGS